MVKRKNKYYSNLDNLIPDFIWRIIEQKKVKVGIKPPAVDVRDVELTWDDIKYSTTPKSKRKR